MSKVYFSIKVAEDGSMTIPAFAARGLGFEPGDEACLNVPLEAPDCDGSCGCNGLFLGRCCDSPLCTGYTSDGDTLNIPAAMLAEGGIPVCGVFTMIAGDKALVLVAGTDEFVDLDEEIGELLCELGADTVEIRSIPVGQIF